MSFQSAPQTATKESLYFPEAQLYANIVVRSAGEKDVQQGPL